MNLISTFRRNLRAAMRAHPLPAKELCKRGGYDHSYVRKVLARATANPTLMFVQCMAEAVGKPVEELLGFREESKMTEYLIITMDNCPYCDKAKAMLTDRGITYREINIMEAPEVGTLPALVGHQTMPLVLKVVGGAAELEASL